MTPGHSVHEPRAALVIALAIVAVAAVTVRWRSASVDTLFGTDEADYARAMAYGPSAVYLGTRERSGLTFLQGVVEQYRATGWARPFKSDWEAGDAAGLRHYHPPVGLYPVSALMAAGVTDERSLRRVPALTSALACVATTMLAWGLLAGLAPAGRAAAASTAGLLAVGSPFHAQNGVELGFHAAFSLFSTLALAAMVHFQASPSRPRWRVVCVATALCILTIPYWILLVLPLALIGWRARRQIAPRHLALDAATTSLVTLVVVWPPYLLNGAFLKSFLLYGGLLARPLAEASQSWLDTFSIAHIATVLMLMALGVATLMFSRARTLAMPAVPVAIFVAEFVLLNLRVRHMKPLYAGDLIAAASALAVVAFLLLRGRVATAAAMVSIAVLAQLTLTPAWSPPPWREPMAKVEAALAGQRVLVTPRPASSMMAYYLRRSQIVLDSSDPDDRQSLRQRIDRGEIDAILQLGPAPEAQGAVASMSRPAPSGDVIAGPAHLTWWDLRR